MDPSRSRSSSNSTAFTSWSDGSGDSAPTTLKQTHASSVNSSSGSPHENTPTHHANPAASLSIDLRDYFDPVYRRYIELFDLLKKLEGQVTYFKSQNTELERKNQEGQYLREKFEDQVSKLEIRVAELEGEKKEEHRLRKAAEEKAIIERQECDHYKKESKATYRHLYMKEGTRKAELKTEAKSAMSKYSQIRKKFNEEIRRRKGLEEALTAAEKERDNYKAKANSVENTLRKEKAEKEGLANDLKAAGDERHRMEQGLNALRSDAEMKQKAVESKCEALRENLNNERLRSGEAEKRVEGKLSELKSQNKELKSQKNEAEAREKNLRNSVWEARLKAKKENREQDDALSKSREQQQKTAEELKDIKRTLQERETRLSVIDPMNEKLTEEKRSWEDERSHLRFELTQLQHNYSSLEARLRELGELQRTVDDLRGTIDNLELSNSRLAEEQNHLLTEYNGLLKKNQDLSAEVQETKDLCIALTTSLCTRVELAQNELLCIWQDAAITISGIQEYINRIIEDGHDALVSRQGGSHGQPVAQSSDRHFLQRSKTFPEKLKVCRGQISYYFIPSGA